MPIILETRGLTKRFGGELVLSDIDLSIESGEIFGLIGKSGAGKSTLARCFNFLETPTSGDVLFDGTSLSSLPPKKLYETRRSMGMIFQQFNLLMQRSVLGNVLFPMEIAGVKKKKAIARARELLDVVKLSDKVSAYPATLSGGQKQRVAIARAMANDPSIILADEPTGALDTQTGRMVMDIFHRLHREEGKTIVLITHNTELANETERVITIKDGEILLCY